MRLMTAFQAFFAVLFNRTKAERILPVLQGEPFPVVSSEKPSDELPAAQTAPQPTEKSCEPSRSEAITLLAALQREARLLDFLMEKLDGYDDAMVGAAARTVHDDCAAVIQRLFDVRSLRTEAEMSQITVETPDAALVQLVGNVSGKAPYTGRLTHCGWVANQCRLPTWSGSAQAALVLAPAEVELE